MKFTRSFLCSFEISLTFAKLVKFHFKIIEFHYFFNKISEISLAEKVTGRKFLLGGGGRG